MLSAVHGYNLSVVMADPYFGTGFSDATTAGLRCPTPGSATAAATAAEVIHARAEEHYHFWR
jgi:hypothetical protein